MRPHIFAHKSNHLRPGARVAKDTYDPEHKGMNARMQAMIHLVSSLTVLIFRSEQQLYKRSAFTAKIRSSKSLSFAICSVTFCTAYITVEWSRPEKN